MSRPLKNESMYVRLLNSNGTAIDSDNKLLCDVTISSATVSQSTAANLKCEPAQSNASLLNATVIQGTAANLKCEPTQMTAGNLNATVVQSTASNLHMTAVVSQIPVNTGTLFNNVTTSGADQKSSSLDKLYTRHVDLYGSVDKATVLTVELSADDTTWYTSNYTYTASGATNIHLSFECAARYIRVSCSVNTTTLTVLGASM